MVSMFLRETDHSAPLTSAGIFMPTTDTGSVSKNVKDVRANVLNGEKDILSHCLLDFPVYRTLAGAFKTSYS